MMTLAIKLLSALILVLLVSSARRPKAIAVKVRAASSWS